MYNLPYISYGIFAFVLVAIWLLAWKKGFRAALCSFVLTLATVGVILAISFGIYSHIAPLFSNYIKEHFKGDPSYDFNYFANAARPQVIAICIAVGFIPVYAMLFGISYPIYRHFKRNDYPRLTKFLGPNSKKVKTVNKKLNKLGAVVATGVTSVASAGFVAAASGVLFTTAGTYNGFNDAMSVLSLGTSYGFSKDSLSLHKMYEFIPMTNDAELMKFSQVIAPSSEKPLTQDEIDKIKASSNYKKFLELIATSESNAILNVLASKYATVKEDVKFYGIDQKDGTNDDFTVENKKNLWRPLGNESSPTQYALDLATLRSLYANVKFGIDDSTAKIIYDWIRVNGIQDFSDTEASKLLDKAIDSRDKAKEELKQAQIDLENRKVVKGKLESQANIERQKMTEAMNQIIVLKVDLANLISSGSPADLQLIPVGNAKANNDRALTTAETYGEDFENYTGITKDLNLSSRPSMDGAVVNNQATYQVKKSNLNNAESTLKFAEEQLTSKINSISNLNGQKHQTDISLSDARTNLSLAKQATQGLEQKASSDLAALNDLNRQYSLNHQEISKNDTALAKNRADLTNAIAQRTPLNPTTDKVEYDRLTNQINSLNTTISNLEYIGTTLAQKDSSLKNDIDQASKASTASDQARDNNKNLITSLELQISTLQNDLSNIESNITSAEGDKSRLIVERDRAQSDLATAKSEFALAQQTANQKLNDYLSKGFDPYKSANGVYQAEKGMLNNLIAQANQKASDLRTKASDYQDAKGKFEDAQKQLAIIDWEVTAGQSFSKPFNGLSYISNSSDFANIANEVLTYDENTNVLGKPVVLVDPKVEQNLVVSFSKVSDVAIDSSIWGPGVDLNASFKFSIPYLNRVADPQAGIQEVQVYEHKWDNKTFDTKLETDIIPIDPASWGKTEGLIAVLNYNIESYDDAINRIFQVYKNIKQEEFNKNVDSYIDIFKQALK